MIGCRKVSVTFSWQPVRDDPVQVPESGYAMARSPPPVTAAHVPENCPGTPTSSDCCAASEDRLAAQQVVLALPLVGVVLVDRAGAPRLTSGVADADVGGEQESELDDPHEDEDERQQDDGELDQRLAALGLARARVDGRRSRHRCRCDLRRQG